VGSCVTYFNLPTWSGARFIPTLSEGGETPEVVYLVLVEKVRVLGDDHVGHAY
jgi:hypothetical protein